MKLLFLSQARTLTEHPGFVDGFNKLVGEGKLEDMEIIPWIGYGEQYGWEAFHKHVVERAERGMFDVVYFHYYHSTNVPSPELCIKKLKSLPHHPTVVCSCGDAFANSWLGARFPVNLVGAARGSDLTFMTSMGSTADALMRLGAKRIVHEPPALDQTRFTASAINSRTHDFEFDVVMVGSRNGCGRNPLSRYAFYGRRRTKLVKLLTNRFGARFGLFGFGWNGIVPNYGPVKFDDQIKTVQRGRVVVGGLPYSTADYYVSNRVFCEIASGIPSVEMSIPRLDKMLRDGEDCYFADSIEGIVHRCEELLAHSPDELYARSAAAAERIINRHTRALRLRHMMETIRRFREEGVFDPSFGQFRPDVNMAVESLFATREAR